MPRPSGPPRPNAARPRPKARPTAKPRPTPKVQPPKPAETPEEPPVTPASKPANQRLKMVPLTGQSEGTYDDGTDLGTSVFARPNREAPPSAPPPAVPPMGTTGGAPPMMGGGPPPVIGPPPVVGMGGIQGPIAGPVAGSAPAAGVPVAGGAYLPPEERATSTRVYLVILGLVLIMCMSILATAGLFLFVVLRSTIPEPLPEIEQQVVVAPTPPVKQADTGAPPDKPASKPKPTRSRSRSRSGSSGTKPAPKPSPKPAAAPEPAGGPSRVSVTLPPGMRASKLEVVCNGGAFRERAPFRGNKAVMENIPDGSCRIVLVGAGIKKSFNFQGSKDFTCSGVGSNFTCR